MEWKQVLRIDCIEANRKPETKDDALREVARSAKASPALRRVDEEEVLEALRAREQLGSTGFGGEIAIPHCRLRGVEEFVVGILTVPEGVEFEALDGKPVRLIAFIVAPAIESDQHIRLLSGLSQILQRPRMVDEIIALETPDRIRSHIVSAEPNLVGTPQKRMDGILFQVFVQSEEPFRRILQIFASIETSSTEIVESKSERAYLARIPLFADFWTDRTEDFGRIILAVTPKALLNEIVRRIEEVTGPLDEVEGVLVAVHPLLYTAGSLGI